MINLSENATYCVEEVDGRRWALPIQRDGYHSKQAIESELVWLMALRRLLLVAWIGSHSETELAKSMGLAYTEGTVGLCENYLRSYA